MALEREEFPYGDGYAQMAADNAASNGAFTFTVPPLFPTTRLRVVTRTSIVAESAPSTIRVAVKVGIRTRRHRPASACACPARCGPPCRTGRLSLQRQSRTGRWHTLRHAKPRRCPAGARSTASR